MGTGPGDPGLLTLHAVQLIQNADVLLYDRYAHKPAAHSHLVNALLKGFRTVWKRLCMTSAFGQNSASTYCCRLVSADILRMAGPSARMVYVGKEKGYHSRTQEEIHELLLQFAEAGALTVRLKGGDPFVFGRGAEESQYLEQRGVCVRIIPGITAAAGVSALLGVPLTHRGVATSVRFVTGHAREGGADALDETIAAAADPSTTLVVYMGLSTLPTLVQQLVSGGLDPSTPALAVERGTAVDSKICHGPASELAELTQQAGLKSPTLIVIGDVVSLSPGWRMWEQSNQPLVMPGPPPLPIDLSPYHKHGVEAHAT